MSSEGFGLLSHMFRLHSMSSQCVVSPSKTPYPHFPETGGNEDLW